MMLPALLVGGLGETALVDEECRLLLGLRDDALRFFLGLLDDPLTLGVDALGGSDLFGNGDAQLVDESERGVLIHDDVRGQGQLLAVGDEGFQPLDEENDVDRSVLLCRLEGPLRRWPDYRTRRVAPSHEGVVPWRRRRPNISPRIERSGSASSVAEIRWALVAIQLSGLMCGHEPGRRLGR